MSKTRVEVARFLGAGVAGAVTDVGMLYVFIALGLSPYVGRLLSFLSAVWVTWQINRRFTFRATDAGQSLWMEWWKYLAAMLGGFVINYVIFTIVMHFGPPGPLLPMAGVLIGAVFAMVFNFVSAKWFVFNRS